MNTDSLAFVPVTELSRLIKTKQVSPVELVDIYLKRIESLNPKLNAFLTVNGDRARAAALEAEKTLHREKELPPLFGIPVSIKDLTATRGVRTTYGSLAYADYVPDDYQFQQALADENRHGLSWRRSFYHVCFLTCFLSGREPWQ